MNSARGIRAIFGGLADTDAVEPTCSTTKGAGGSMLSDCPSTAPRTSRCSSTWTVLVAADASMSR
jgi:hypothetical protein